MNRRFLFALLLFVAAALSACAGEVNLLDETKLQDTSLLSGEPCEAPCWNGITPGETSYRDAWLLLESDERIKISEEAEPEGENTGRAFSFAEGENQPCCQVISRDGETITSFILQLAPAMTYGPVFDKYGEPTYAAGQQVNDEQGYAVLVYPETPMVIYAHVSGAAEGTVSVHNRIFGVMYMAAAQMGELLNCARLHTWKGFVSLGDYADGEKSDYIGSGVGDETVCPES